jgi:TP901 family phage tail tape measure protein
MNTAVVGAARIVFGADTSEFDSAAKGVEGVLGRLVDKFHAVEQRIKSVGTGITLGITVPFAAMVRAIDKGAGSFEAQMKRVEAALGNVSADELKQLAEQARTLGPAVGKGATEAAEAIEALGLAGVSTSDILGGALKASLDLSAAGMVDASTSAALVTDVMGQFKISAAELPGVVQKVVGALDTSKFNFDDFRLAVGQGGAVAAAAGVDFVDFATAISATSTQFTSGADAGTSFKTYIQSLVGISGPAKAAMKKLGISFFDANGQMKPLAEQAEILRTKLGDLSDESKTEALSTIFGSDAARTAIGLMEQGAKGFEKLQAEIGKGDVDKKIQKRLEGSEAAGKRVATAWESVKIAFGLETPILSIVTAIKNGFARMLEAIANAPPAVKQLGAAFAGIAAVLGPVLILIGHVGAVLLASFAASKFGLIGRAIALIISPVSTIIGMLGEYGLARVLTMVATRFLALAGPVGWAITAFLLFKDQIMTALAVVWDSFSKTLGPPLDALFGKLSALFSKLTGGPIGSAVEALTGLLGGVADVVGTILVGAIEIAGNVIERALGGIIAAFSGMVDVVTDVVDVVSALLSGDFAGAWQALVSLVEDVFAGIVAVISAIIPEISGSLQEMYNEAKGWLVDKFHSIAAAFTGIVKSAVDYVASILPTGIISAARSLYQGVRGWLVDKFGALMDWVGKKAAWIGDQYAGLKKRLGLGGSSAGGTTPPPPKPKEVPAPKVAAPKRTVSFDDDTGGSKKKGGGGSPKGRNTTYDAANRQQLQDDLELEAARLRGDQDAERAIRNRLDLSKQIEAYQRTGLSLEAATTAAKRDMAALEAARRVGLAKDLERDEAGHQIDLARITDNHALEAQLERQQELKERILAFQRDGLSLEEATARAVRQQLETDQARAKIREQLLADDEQDRHVALAKARGDSEERIRQLQREIDIRDRARQLEHDFEMDPTSAKDKASREWDEEEKARQTGVFRDTFKDGVRAALDGDLKGWFKDWWKDRVAKGMEEALNSLADLIAKLFSNIGSKSGGGGIGGFIGSLGSAIGGLFGGSKLSGVDYGAINSAANNVKLPGFKTGGSFKVGGRSGIDQNVVSFRATAGEIVNIERPGNDNGPGGGSVHIVPSPYFDAIVDQRATKVAAPIGVAAAMQGRSAAGSDAARAARRRIPGRG